MIYCVDIDGTICRTTGEDYGSALPIEKRINHLNRLFDEGNTVVYWTARGSGSGIDYHGLTKKQLDEWGVKYSELKMGKPVYDVWVDDRATEVNKFFEKKTIAVVCSAAYLMGMNLGKEIDAADKVVRVNYNYRLTSLHPKDIGRRTDVVYLCGSLYRSRRSLRVPKGAEIRKVNMLILGAKSNGYVANTGVRAIIDYALAGHEVRAYGLDFYASANGGVIPQGPVLRGNGRPLTFKRNKVYLPGYRGQDGTVTISHVGGTKDVELLIRYMNDYPIYCDNYMKQLLDNHKKIALDKQKKQPVL